MISAWKRLTTLMDLASLRNDESAWAAERWFRRPVTEVV